ncbi:unnamed protein product, partial [Allacma fusca]
MFRINTGRSRFETHSSGVIELRAKSEASVLEVFGKCRAEESEGRERRGK